LLKNELTGLYGSEDFKGKCPFKLLQWFHSYIMATAFEQMYKLANLVSTIAATAASVEGSFEALKEINIRKD
jgi:hypothetical protein